MVNLPSGLLACMYSIMSLYQQCYFTRGFIILLLTVVFKFGFDLVQL